MSIEKDWNNRDKIKTKESAMFLVSERLARYDALPNDGLDQVEEFCRKHDIPFSKDLFVKLTSSVSELNEKAVDWDSDEYSPWLTSSAYC